MAASIYRLIIVVGLCLGLQRVAAAAPVSASGPGVQVDYTGGATELDTVKEGVKLFLNRNYALTKVPAEIAGAMLTRRAGGAPADVQIDASAGSTVYIFVNSDKEGVKGEAELDKQLSTSGWTRLADAEYGGKYPLAVFKRTFANAQSVKLKSPMFAGFVVAAKNLTVKGNAPADAPVDHAPAATVHSDPVPDTTPIAGAATRPASVQASIEALEIYETESGMMLGQTSEVVLTVTRGEAPKLTAVRFVTPVGNDMSLARDDAMRFIRLTYPNWNIDKAELTFEDKYAGHDGGSIGTAVGTLTMAVIQGFQIDPNIAITGDISANGKVRAIGGVGAKARGAIEGKCSLMALPMENYDQLVDAVIHNGKATVWDIQVLGITNLADAIGTVRVDRDPSLSQAIKLFESLQKEAKGKPSYLTTKEAQDQLSKILEIAPRHLSAKVLLAAAQGTLPKTLSATASEYYTFMAVDAMLDVLAERAKTTTHAPPSTTVQAGLLDLQKLRPMADPSVRPLIDAWTLFIQTWTAQQQGTATIKMLDIQRQALLDEMAKEKADAEMMQKKLKEGI